MNFMHPFTQSSFFMLLFLTLYPANTCCDSDDHHLNKSVIGFYEERDLELFKSSDHSHPGVFLARLDSTYTSYGKNQLIHHLKNPVADAALLELRQQQLHFLFEHPELLQELKSTLADIGRNQAGLIDCISTDKDPLIEQAIKNFYFNYAWFEKLNDSPLALDMLNYMKYVGLFGPVLEHLTMHIALDYIQERKNGHNHGDHTHSHDHRHENHHHGHSCSHTLTAPLDSSLLMKSLFFLIKVGHFGVHALAAKEMISQIISEKALINQLHAKVAYAQACLSGMKQVCILLKESGYQPTAFGLPGLSIDYFDQMILQKGSPFNAIIDNKVNIQDSIGFFSPIGSTSSTYQL